MPVSFLQQTHHSLAQFKAGAIQLNFGQEQDFCPVQVRVRDSPHHQMALNDGKLLSTLMQLNYCINKCTKQQHHKKIRHKIPVLKSGRVGTKFHSRAAAAGVNVRQKRSFTLSFCQQPAERNSSSNLCIHFGGTYLSTTAVQVFPFIAVVNK